MAAGPEIESIRPDNLPSPEQIGRLATGLVEFARRHGKLSTYGDIDKGSSRKHIVKPVQYFEQPSLDIPDVYLLQMRTGAHLEDNLDGIQRLRVSDSVVRKEFATSGGRGVRSFYDFYWTDYQTLSARRKIAELPRANQPKPMIDIVDTMVTTGKSPFRDTDATAMYMSVEIGQITAEDTDLLSAKIDEIIDQVDSGQRPYHESDSEQAGFIARR